MITNTPPSAKHKIFSPYQKFVVGILAFLQFTIILDFMIISPLGAIVMPALHISTHEFGLTVSSYAFSAAISGIAAAGFADRTTDAVRTLTGNPPATFQTFAEANADVWKRS